MPDEHQTGPSEGADPAGPPARGGAWRLAVSLLTVLPVRSGTPDRARAGHAMLAAPFVGMGLGAAAAVVAALALLAGLPMLVVGIAAIGALALLTRGLHLDGLADTVDGLGSYAGRDRALAVMKAPDIGAFGVIVLVLVLLTQVAAVASLGLGADLPSTDVFSSSLDPAEAGADLRVVVSEPSEATATAYSRGMYVGSSSPDWFGLTYFVLLAGAVLGTAAATGRLAITWACREGVPAARPDGLGALVAGTVSRGAAVLVTVPVLLLAAVASALTGYRVWQGPLGVVLGLAVAALLVRHCVRRFGGITGDVLGATAEIATTVTLLTLVATA